MINVLTIEDKVLKKIFSNRKSQSDVLWDIVEKSYKKNKKQWAGQPDWLTKVPRGRSKVQDNRIFMATESQITKLTSRPVKPVVTPANETDDAQTISQNIQKILLDSYRDRGVKKSLKRGLRYLHMSRLLCLKVFWNDEIDDYDVGVVDSRKVRFAKNSTNESESEFAIEEVNDKTILDFIDLFPHKEKEILKAGRITKDEALSQNQDITYNEMWIGDGVVWIFNGEVIEKKRNPYWDWEGLLLTPEEMAELKETEELTDGTRVPKVNGRRRKQMFDKFKKAQPKRKEEQEGDASKYQQYLYNHFNKVRKPYIFGTIFEIESQPIGETTLIEIVTPLQIGVDKRKRQIDDNSDFMNGITKVDTNIADIDLADARSIHYDPEGLLYGPGVSNGVVRESGTALPTMVFTDMQDSRDEIDVIFGTTATFRGEGGKQETATGRAILREEGLSRLDEVADLIDFVGLELYKWWYHLIKIKYTETHMTKILGGNNATETIELMQDDLQDGTEVKIQPGQNLPDDKLFRSERAREDVQDGIIDPVTYLEMAGGYDNPEQIVKRAILFKANPFSVLQLDGEELQDIEQARRVLAIVQGQDMGEEGGEAGEGEGGDEAKAQQIAQVRDRMQAIVSSPEFQKLPDEEKKQKLQEMKQTFQKLGGVEINRQLA